VRLRTLLPSEINYALAAATNLVQQLVIAKFSRQRRYALSAQAMLAFGLNGGLLVLIYMRSKPALKKTTWQAPCGASAGISSPHVGQILSARIIARRAALLLPSYCVKFLRGYARTTEIKWRNSSSISTGVATVWAISSRNNVW